jgi:integrase
MMWIIIALPDLSKIQRANEISNLPKVKSFLDSMGRGSIKSRRTYSLALVHLQDFLDKKYSHDDYYNCETILKPITQNKINIYEVFDGFVSHLLTKRGEATAIANAAATTTTTLSTSSIIFYLAALRSYFAYHDIDIIPSKFRRRVKIPKVPREDEQPLDVEDIRKMLLSCHNRRLKAYLLVLASGGLRALEGLVIRLKDIDFAVSPTKIHVRKEYAKTKIARDIYISDEATRFLKQWLEWKYHNERRNIDNPNTDDLVFTVSTSTRPLSFYPKVAREFQKLLSVVKMNERKEGMKRLKITLHSFRRFCKSVISNQVNQDYSEWFIGHNKSPYYTIKESERRRIYAEKCMKYLTFLDYTTLDAAGKNVEAKLSEKDKEIESLKQKMAEMEKMMHTTGEKLEVKVIRGKGGKP